MDTKKERKKKNCVTINIRSGDIPILRAGWANIMIPISIIFIVVINGFLKELNTIVLLRYLIISIGFFLLIREYILDVSSISLYDEFIKFQCSILTKNIYYRDIRKVKIKKYNFMAISVIKVKLKNKLYYYKFNLGPSIKNIIVFKQSANKLKEFLIKRGIEVV